jgi:hypothetical protein
MSKDDARLATVHKDGEEVRSARGTNLVLWYSLVALALAAAIGFALMIVAPFYHRR